MLHLHQHRNLFYYRRKLPNSKKTLVLSLKTSDKLEAKFIIGIINTRLSLFFRNSNMTPDEEVVLIQETVKQYIEEAKDDYGHYASIREQQYKHTNKKGVELLGSHPKAIKKAIDNLTDMLYSANKDIIYNQIIQASTMAQHFNNVFLQLSATNQERLKDEVIKGEIELLYLDKERNEQRVQTPNTSPTYLTEDFAKLVSAYNAPYVPIYQTPQQQPTTNDRFRSKTIQEIFEQFLQSKSKELKEPERYVTDLNIFLDLVKKDYLIDITHEDFSKFYDDIQFIPNRNKNRKLYADNQNYTKIIKIAKEKMIEPISESTVANKLININAFLDYAVDYEYLDLNRLRAKCKLSTKGDPDKRKEYYDEQLEKLFYHSSWYTNELHIHLENYPSKIWIPLILLFQGFRLNEIAQIYLDQIVDKTVNKQDTPFFRIEATHPDQQLKNYASKRKLPVHPKLIELGILKFIQQQRDKGHQRLFPELYFTTDKGYGQAFSKHFNTREFKKEWLDEEAINKLEEGTILLDLHSFRHNFDGSLKSLIEDSLLSYFMGHITNKETFDRYGKTRPKILLEGISKCEYEDLDLSKLSEKINAYYDNAEKAE